MIDQGLMVGLKREMDTLKELVKSMNCPSGSQGLLLDVTVSPLGVCQCPGGICDWLPIS